MRAKQIRNVGSKSTADSMACDFCQAPLGDDAVPVGSGGLVFLSCVECDLLNEEPDCHGQMSATDPLNHYFITPTQEAKQ